jgi:hypothetical protein
MIEPITVGSYLRLGKLIKTWATGVSYFTDDSPPISIDQLPVPRSLDDFKRQCALVRAEVVIPDSISGITFVAHSSDTMVIKLPPKERVEAKEGELSQPGGSYPFPDFYKHFLNGDLTEAQKLQAHACRIGDYSISMCG